MNFLPFYAMNFIFGTEVFKTLLIPDSKYTLFFNKNTLYKNVHDENGQKIKNMVRISPSWNLATEPKNAILKAF